VVWSDPFRFRTMRTVASLDDFGPFAESAFSLARATFGHVERAEETVRHCRGTSWRWRPMVMPTGWPA
jgi:hypothetical protein